MKDTHFLAARLPSLVILIGSTVTVAIGVAALLGWVFGLLAMTSYGVDFIPMAPSTAVLFILYGAAVGLHARTPLSRRAHRAGVAMVVVGTLIAFLVLVLSYLDIRATAEHLGLDIATTVGETPRGYMSPVSALCFLLASASFLASVSRPAAQPRRAVLALFAASAILATCFVFLLAYLFGTPLLYGGRLIPPALNSVLAFVMLGLALLAIIARPAALFRTSPEGGSRFVRVSVLVFPLLSMAVVTAGYIHYRNYESYYSAQAERQLGAIADLKVDEVVLWRKERLADADALHNNAAFSSLVRRCFERPEDPSAPEELRSWLEKIRKSSRYDRLTLHDAATDRWMWFSDTRELISPLTTEKAREAERSGRLVFLDFYRSEHTGTAYLRLIVPILYGSPSRAIGALTLRIDPSVELFPLLQRWPTPSETSEFALIRREGSDVVLLNDLRFQGRVPLAPRIPLSRTSLPSVKAVLGETGSFKGLDYRGVPVLATLRAVPDSPWYLVAKVDAEEVYAPMRARFWTTVVLVGSVLTAVGTTIASFWRRQQVRFYRERAEAAEALRASERKYEIERKYRAILDQTLEFIGMLAPDGTVTEINGAALKFAGVRESDVVEKPFWETPWWTHSQEMQDRLRKAVKDVAAGEFVRFEATHRASDGEIHYIDFSLKPVKNESGEVLFLIPEGRDITDLKRAEEGMREFETRFRDIIDNSREGILFVDMDAHTIFSANQAMAAMLGCTPEDLAGMPILDIHPPEARDRIAQEFEQHRTGDRQVSTDVPVLRKDGSRIYADIVSTMLTLNGVRYMSGFFRDVTDRKKAEDAVRQHERELTARNEELTRFNAAATGRELRMIELKQEVNGLCGRIGEPPRYGLQFLEENAPAAAAAPESKDVKGTAPPASQFPIALEPIHESASLASQTD